MQGIYPMVAYRNGRAALPWLSRAFGFRVTGRLVDRDGRLVEAQVETGHGEILVSGEPWIVALVDDVETHYERALRAGARLLSEIEEDGPPGKRYRVEDPEGHRWMFVQVSRAAAPGRPPRPPAPRGPAAAPGAGSAWSPRPRRP